MAYEPFLAAMARRLASTTPATALEEPEEDTLSVLPEFTPYTPPKSRRAFQQVAIPIMAAIETLSTKGESPGTAALTAGNYLRQMDKDKAEEQRKNYQAAMERLIKGEQLKKSQREAEKEAKKEAAEFDKEAAQRAAMKRFLGTKEDLTDAERLYAELDPQGFLKTQITPEKVPEWRQKLNYNRYLARGKTGKLLTEEEKAVMKPEDVTAYETGLAEYNIGKGEFEREEGSKGKQRKHEIEKIKLKSKLEAERQKLLNQFKDKDFSQAEIDTVTDSQLVLKKFNILQGALIDRSANIFTTGFMGREIFAPLIAEAIHDLTELHGREKSGAAISKQEWANFRKQILNPKNLATEEGRRVALQKIQDLMQNQFLKGRLSAKGQWGDFMYEVGLSYNPIQYPEHSPKRLSKDKNKAAEEESQLTPGSYYEKYDPATGQWGLYIME